MTQDARRQSSLVSRRQLIATVGGAGAVALAGCASSSDNGNQSDGGNTSTGAGGQNPGPLEAGGSSTVYPVAQDASSYWEGNRPASDSEYWPHSEYGIETDKNLADYWAGLYGFEADGDREPPYSVDIALSHSGTGVKDVRDGLNDIGNSSGNVEDELPDRGSYEKFKDHVIAVDGQPLVVSSEIKEQGVTGITGQELKDLYKGRISNWSELGGPDRPVQVLGRVKGSGTRTSFVSNVFGNAEENTSVKNRFGQNQRLAEAVAGADNAVSYLALTFVDTDGLEPIDLTWEGTTYSYQDDQNGLDSREYPLSRDLHMYTWEETSMKEAAFINMILSDFGQETFVKPNNYFTLGQRRREEERSKLPDQTPA